MATDAVAVDLDSRNRVSLGRHATAKRYIMNALPDGTITLVPATTITFEELAVLQDPERLASIREGLRQSAAGETVDLSERVAKLADLAEDD